MQINGFLGIKGKKLSTKVLIPLEEAMKYEKDEKYKNLLMAQNNFIQQNTNKIRNKAEKLYKIITVDKKEFFINLSCNFKLLEKKANEYKSK